MKLGCSSEDQGGLDGGGGGEPCKTKNMDMW